MGGLQCGGERNERFGLRPNFRNRSEFREQTLVLHSHSTVSHPSHHTQTMQGVAAGTLVQTKGKYRVSKEAKKPKKAKKKVRAPWRVYPFTFRFQTHIEERNATNSSKLFSCSPNTLHLSPYPQKKAAKKKKPAKVSVGAVK